MAIEAPPLKTKEDLAADGMLGIKDAVKFSGLSKTMLYRYMDRGELPYSKMGPGSRRLIPKRALVTLMAEHMVIGDGWAFDDGRERE